MDPFIEGQLWRDFHNDFLSALREALVPALRPGYIALLEERVYLEHDPEERPVQPDLSLARTPAALPAGGSASASTIPVSVPLLMPEEVHETNLEIRHRDTRELVTVIELLSPTNKRPGSDGRREYLRKRELVLRSPIHLVELDLLRGGARLPMARELPPAHFYALVSRAHSRPMADVWPIQLREPLPTILVPLRRGDADVAADLQSAFTAVYRRAGYDYVLDYQAPLSPPLPEDDAEWCAGVNR